MKILKYTLFSITAAILASCNSAPAEDAPTKCYEREIKMGGNTKDRFELFITQVNDVEVKGTFNWLPAQKDSRKGTFDGKVADKLIMGDYTFTQEGKTQSVPIIIDLTTSKAVIKGADNSFGMEVTLNPTKCK